MNRKWDFGYLCLSIFVFGGFCMSNLLKLLPINESYEGSWFNVFYFIIFSICLSIMAWNFSQQHKA